MKNMKNLLLFVFIFACTAFIGAVNPINEFKVFKLKNGLTIYINEDSDASKVYGAVVVNAGGKNDPKDSTGIAHYLEHMLFKGTKRLGTADYSKESKLLDEISKLYTKLGKERSETKRKEILAQINDISVKASEYAIPNEFDRLSQSIGADQVNAYTSNDMTVYYSLFPANELVKWVELNSERFIEPVFRLFQPELEVVYEEKNRSLDNWQRELFETYFNKFFKKHPYGQQTILGSVDHLKNPSLDKMYKFFNDYYVANNMALIISGNIKTEQIIGEIENKFGRLRSGNVPKFPLFKEADFKGREFHEIAVSPIEVGVAGYRVPNFNANNPKDFYTMDIIKLLLNNSGQTGLLDKLKNEGKVLELNAYYEDNKDHASFIFLFVPLVGQQTLTDAENLIYPALDMLKNGTIDTILFSSVLTNYKILIEQALESQRSKVNHAINSYIYGIDVNKFSDKGLEILNTITIDDIKKAASKYFTDNRLVLYSKVGQPGGPRLEKPGFTPVKQNDSKSEYAVEFAKLKSLPLEPAFVDFGINSDSNKKDNSIMQSSKHFETAMLGKNKLYRVNNPVNGISKLSISYGIGMYDSKLATYLDYYLNKCGTTKLTGSEFKVKMFENGINYSISSSKNYFTVTISGLDEKIENGIKLINELLTSPEIDKSIIELLVNETKADREFEEKNTDTISKLIHNYLLLKEKSPYIDRPSLEEIKNFTPEVLLRELETIKKYTASIHYSGNIPLDKLTDIIKNNFSFVPSPLPMKELWSFNRVKYTEPVVYFVDKPGIAQSQIHLFIEGKPYKFNDDGRIDGFNEYFGDGMSSIVFQEIRELKSLAYTAYSVYLKPPAEQRNGYLYGFIGTQTDKTFEAIDTLIDLIRNIPMKPDRIDLIKEGLISKASTNKRGFRALTPWVEDNIRYGYTMDPNEYNISLYRTLSMDEITNNKKNYRNRR